MLNFISKSIGRVYCYAFLAAGFFAADALAVVFAAGFLAGAVLGLVLAAGFVALLAVGFAPRAFTWSDRRESFRAAVFFFRTFFLTDLSRLLCTFLSASAAFLPSFAAIAAARVFISARSDRLVF